VSTPGEDKDTTKAGPVTPAVPATEARGGRAVDWNAVQAGEPLPERDDPLEKDQLDEEA
jgi:hypothetical protein